MQQGYQVQQTPPMPQGQGGAPSYTMPPQSMPPPQMYGTPNSNVTTVLIGSIHGSFSEVPQRHTCQFCSREVVTEVRYESGTLTWIAAGGLVLVGCVAGCCLIPFFVDGCKDVVHVCPNCHTVVGRKNRI